MTPAFPSGGRGPVSGVGIGLRDPHFQSLMNQDHGVPWLELLADNFLARGGLTPRQLDRIVERYPVTLHCVGMNLGGTDPIDRGYLKAIATVARRSRPAWISDHLCFTAHRGRHYHDLLPLPYDDETVRHVARRIQQVQDFFGRRLVVENVSAYVRAAAPLTEAAFIAAVCDEADCELLLDINNLYVNQVNLGSDTASALKALPLPRVREVHLAGYEDNGGVLIDAHNHRVSEPVWQIFGEVIRRLPDVAVCIEWDNDIPALPMLLAEAGRAVTLRDRHRSEAA
jgi:uncharacterized protein (UPF0276 family)